MTALAPIPVLRIYDNSGNLAIGAKVYTYAAGTSTPQATYTDSSQTTPNTNPVVANSRGEVTIWLGTGLSYKIVAQDAAGNLLFTADNVTGPDFGSAALSAALLDSSDITKGDALVIVKQPYTNAVPITQHSFNSEWLNVLQFGAIGTADDSLVFNTALSAASVSGLALFVPPGTITLTPITFPSNVTLEMHPKALLKAKTGFGANDRLLNIVGASNVSINGHGASAQMLKGEYTTGEQRHCVFMINSTDVRISDLNAIDSGGDGFYVGRDTAGGTHCKRVWLTRCRAANNRRQGLSVVSAEDFWAEDCVFMDTVGTKPACGIDIEPNDGLDVLTNINIVNCRTDNNYGGGILVALRAFSGVAGNTVSIKITGHVTSNDGNTDSGENVAGFMCVGSNGGAWGNKVYGEIVYENFTILNSKGSGLRSNRQDAARAPLLIVRNGAIINPGSGASPVAEDMCGVVIWSQDAGGSDWGNITMQKVSVYDTRGVVGTYSPVYIYGTAGLSGVGQARGIHLKDVMGVGFTPTSGRGHLVALADMASSTVEYTDEQVITDFLNTDPVRTRAYAGYTVVQPAGGVIQLPRSSLNTGLSWMFRQTTDSTSIQIRPDANDTIDYAHAQASDLVLSRKEASVKLTMSAVAGVVRTDYIHDLAKRVGGTGGFASSAPPGRVYYGSAPPATGTWLIADRTVNSAPGVGSPKAWTCTVSGTPGTWVSEGNL